MANILIINGDPHDSSVLTDAANGMVRVFEQEGAKAELFRIGNLAIRGCADCGACAESGKCVFEEDPVRELTEKLEAADGLVVCSPICFRSPSGTVISLMDRLFRSARFPMEGKVGACWVSGGDGEGFAASANTLNQYFGAAGMKIASVSFWTPDEDEETGGEPGHVAEAGLLARRVLELIGEIKAAEESEEKTEITDDYVTKFDDGDFDQLRKRPVSLFLLDENKPEFPNPRYASETGFLAVGGDATPEWLAAAYSRGIIPWSDDGAPLMWYCPQDRVVFRPGDLHVSKTMARFMRNHTVTLSINRDFADTMHRCRMKREFTEEGTWITDEVEEAYMALYEAGYAYSAEAFVDGELAGGQYGIHVGGCVIGESMFYLLPDGSKMALALLLRYMEEHGCVMYDCQTPSELLARMGAKHIPYDEYRRIMKKGLKNPPDPSIWRVEGYQKQW